MKSIRRPIRASWFGKGTDPAFFPRKPRRKPIRRQAAWLCVRTGVLALALLVLALPSGVLGANEPLAVVLAVDTSGSMKKTDPRNLRREASKLLVSLFGPEDRIGFVTFDTQASVRCPLESASNNKVLLAAQIDRIRSDGKFTDLCDGLSVAHETLGPPGSHGRKAIVFLTDGKMDTGDPDQDLKRTQTLLGERLPRLSEEKVPVYAIAFSPLADAALLDRIATATGGFFYSADSAEDLHSVLLRIYRQLARPDTLPVQGKTFLVDPSVREMTIVVTKTGPKDTVGLRTSGGRRLTRDTVVPGVRWFAAEAFEMVTVESPEAGTWEIDYRQEAPREVFILTDLNLLSSFGENALAAGAARPVETWLEEKGEKLPFGMLRTQGVEFRCELEPERGNRVEVPLRDDGLAGDRKAGDGIFSGVIEPNAPGAYRLSVSALGKTFERRLVREFRVLEHGLAPPQPQGDAARTQPGPAQVRPAPKPEALQKEAPKAADPAPRNSVNWKLEIAQFFMVNAGLAAAAAAVFVIARGRKKRNFLPRGSKP